MQFIAAQIHWPFLNSNGPDICPGITRFGSSGTGNLLATEPREQSTVLSLDMILVAYGLHVQLP